MWFGKYCSYNSYGKIEFIFIRKEFNLKHSDKILIFVGRIGKEKRVIETYGLLYRDYADHVTGFMSLINEIKFPN